MEANNLIYVFGVLFVLSSLIKLVKIDHWIIRFFDFPQLQFLSLGILVLVSAVVWLDIYRPVNFIFIASVLGVALYQASLIFPYTVLHSKEIKSSKVSTHDLKVLVSNVYQPNESYQAILDLIDEVNPDVVFLVETNQRWEENLKVLEQKFSYHLKEPLDNMYGLLFYTNLALKNAEIRHIVKDDIPSVRTKLLLKNGKEILFYGVHPEPPSPTENFRSSERDAELYLLAKEIRSHGPIPTVVVGDLNDVAWSKSTRIFQKISRLLDPRKGRGFFNTYHAKYPIRWPLDHFFISDHFRLIEINVHHFIGSDHFPVSMSIKYAPDNNNEDLESVDQDDRQEAKRQINKAT